MNRYIEAIEKAKEYMRKIDDPAHDIKHAEGVVNNALEISAALNYPDKRLIEVAAWWHDVGRLFNSVHEELSALMAKEYLFENGFSKEEAELVFESIRYHKWNMKPLTKEGNIIKDADKLEFISIDRWKNCILKSKYEHIIPIIKLIPKMNEILYFKESKEIYYRRHVNFRTYIQDLLKSKSLDLPFIDSLKDI